MTRTPNRARPLLAASVLLILAACTSVQYQADQMDEHINRATRQDVIAFFGPPEDVQELEGGGERWVYRYSYTSIGGTAAYGHRTCWENVLTFDQEGILRAHEERRC